MYRILEDFTDKYDSTIKYKIGEEHKFTKKRAKEILSVGNLIEEITEDTEVITITKVEEVTEVE
jgi:hypothetical protein